MAARKGFGTKLYRETTPGSGGAGTSGHTQMGGLTNLNWPELLTDFAETTEMDSADAMRTRTPTLKDLGPVTSNINYDSSDPTQAQLQADWLADTVRKYKIIGTDAGADDVAFNAYVARFQVISERDGLVTAALTLQPTGARTQT